MRSFREKIADTFGGVTYSIVTGAMLDYSTGLDFKGMVGSRTSATGINYVASAPYGLWRNFIFRKMKATDDSFEVKRVLTELVEFKKFMRWATADFIAFNTLQVPIYATAVAIGSYCSEGRVDWEKVRIGSLHLVLASPLIGPTMGWYMDWIRKAFKIESAAKQARKAEQTNV